MFALVFTRSRDPLQIPSFGVTIGINPHQPAIGSRPVADYFVELTERREAKFNASIMVIMSFPVMRIAAPASLTVITVVDGVGILGRRLTVPEIGCASSIVVEAAARLSGAIAELIASDLVVRPQSQRQRYMRPCSSLCLTAG